jgi:polyisoprenoid-binding protein YceI
VPPDFLNAEKYPHIHFKSTNVAYSDRNQLRITGDLTIHGITKEIIFMAEFTGPEKSPYGETSIGFTANGAINREDYNIMWNVFLENGGVMVGREIRIVLDIEADLQEQ